ncbi:MAG: RNA polymerase sigma-70 factor [Prevotella sp.]|nr:RNA polymerase sigma-70 factor [Prevotella sp.]
MQPLSIEAIARWDSDAAKMLYEHYYGALVSYALQFLKDKDAAEDTVQDTMAALWERKVVFSSVSVLKAYLYNTVRNRCLNQLRQLQTDSGRIQLLSSQFEEFKITDDGQEPVFSEEVYRQLFLMIDLMPPRQREVLLMVMKGHKNREIAEALNMAVETVRTNKKRAVAFLRERLDKDALLLLMSFLAQ